ncbi:MAG: DUF4982 domain-containing protein [Rikenellaceae bacterium]|nr:DUF4982 domain-containing protein [Rikenellaceae bacterium]
MKKFLITLSFIAVVLCADAASERSKYNFNLDWKVAVGENAGAEDPSFYDKNWKSVTLPYAWNEDDAFRVAIDELPTSIAWYRKTFRLPASDKGKKVFLEFEGVRQGGTVYVNGQKMILHENGVMAFGIDITDAVKFGKEDNVVAVRTDNDWDYKETGTDTKYQWNNKNFNANYGGIPKNVVLHVTPRVYQTLPLYNNLKTTGVYIYASDIDIENARAVINAESEIKNESVETKTMSYNVTLTDMDGKKVARFDGVQFTIAPGETKIVKANQMVEGLNFWSWGYGYLYNVATTLTENGKPVDEVVTRTGFRKTQFGEGMIWLNDRVIQMKGYAQRTSNEWPAVGMSVPAWVSDYSNSLIIEGNGNMVRWMHVTPWKQDIESADRVGLIHAMPAGDAEKDVEGRQWEQRKELMRDAIIYNRNNPSILFYECGNESISFEHMAEMIGIRDQYDPHGGRAIGSREMLDIDIAEYGGEMLYINKSGKHPMWAMEYSRDEGLRKYWDHYSYPYHKEGAGPLYRNADASDYNHNQDMFAVELIRRWNDYYVFRPGTGRRVSSGGAKIIFSDSNTHFRGEENYRRSGVVDPMRIPKDGFFAHKVMWDGWVDLDNCNTYIIGHWNYPYAAYDSDSRNIFTQKDIYVVSAAPKVELFVNGKSAGEAVKQYNFLNTFKDVRFEPGTLKAVSYDENGTELSSYVIETAGQPVGIRMKAIISPNGMLADGTDLALIEFEVVDAEGRRCPLANDYIQFEISGPAEWRGGIAQGPDNFILSKVLPVECGINRAFVRSTTKAGKITVTAKSGILEPATVTIETKPVKVVDGLATTFQKNDLPSYMAKGPTPKSPSFTVSRETIGIASAVAGANQDKAINSYDDNELSEWTNDGRLSTAWIRYELEREANISEVDVKFTGWRMRSYPIKVYVDNTEVWSGDTPRSLGYVTLAFEPVRGKTVTIRLVGENTEEEAFGSIVELDPNVELDLFRDPNAANVNGQLRIVEIDINERVN